MSVDVDPLASLRGWELEVELGGDTYQVMPRMAGHWLAILVQNPMDPAEILPGMVAEDQQETLEDALLTGVVAANEVREAALEVIADASGRPWWWTLRLVQAAVGSWAVVHGSLVAAGVRLADIPLGAAVDAIYVTCMARMDKEHREAFDRDLEIPPVQEEIDEQREAENFLNLMNSGR